MGTRIHADFIRSMARVRGQIVEVLNLDQALDQEHLSDLIGVHLQARMSQAAAAHLPSAWTPQPLHGSPTPAPVLTAPIRSSADALAA
jgi:hypothetical protein